MPAPSAIAEPILDEKALLRHAQSVFAASVQWRGQDVDDRWIKDQRLYHGQFDPQKKGQSDTLIGQGKLFIPKVYSHVQRILVDVLDALYGDGQDVVDVVAWKTIPAEIRLTVKTLLTYRCQSHPINLYAELYEAVLDALTHKVGIWKIYPNITAAVVEEPDPIMGHMIQSRRVIHYEPKIECVPFEDVYFDPRATWKDYRERRVVHRFRRTKDQLQRAGYQNLDQLKAPMTWTHTNDQIAQERAAQQGTTFFDERGTLEGQQEYLCYEFWDWLDLDGSGQLTPCSYTGAGDAGGPDVIIRAPIANDYPWAPAHCFVVGSALPEPHVFYGKSFPENLEGLQRETNAIRNQRRENVALALRAPTLASRNANLDLNSLLNRRIGGITMGDDISENAVRQLPVQDVTQSAFRDELKNDQDFYEVSGIPPGLLGAPTSPDETATAVSSREANANKKISQIIRNLGQSLMLPSMKMLLQMEQEYESDEFIALITGRVLGWGLSNAEDPMPMPTRESIRAEFDLTVNLGTNKQQQLNQLLMLMDRANLVNQTTMALLQAGVVPMKMMMVDTPMGKTAMPMPNAKFVNTMALFERILPLFGERNVDEFSVPAMQPPPMMGQPAGIASQTGAPNNQGSPVGPSERPGQSGNGL